MDSEKDIEDDQEEEGEPQVPPLSKWSSVMDDIIDEAVSEGFFDNLPGQGKPLNLSRSPFGKESELAFDLLKHNEYTLPWIAERTELLDKIEGLRLEIKRAWNDHSTDYQAKASDADRLDQRRAWVEQLAKWREEIEELNQAIAKTNLKQPGEKLEIFKVNLESELKRAGAESGTGNS